MNRSTVASKPAVGIAKKSGKGRGPSGGGCASGVADSGRQALVYGRWRGETCTKSSLLKSHFRRPTARGSDAPQAQLLGKIVAMKGDARSMCRNGGCHHLPGQNVAPEWSVALEGGTPCT